MTKPEPFGRTLARGVCLGWWTLDDLDTPSPAYLALERDRAASANPCDPSNPYDRVPVYPGGEGGAYLTFPRPVMSYPPAVPYRNLAREWIADNPQPWRELQERYRVTPDPAVQVSDPRDFTPTTGATPAQTLDLPLTTEDPLDDLPF
jgi:hypothetical protein